MKKIAHSVEGLRSEIIAQALFKPVTLRAAINRMGFVQADPIRSPATAQELILRHRVNSYRVGDLERRYEALNLEEDVLYAYGFMTEDIWQLLHPRNLSEIEKFERDVLKTVLRFGQMHPRELQEHFGAERVVNAWGGYSKATTRALENLHYRGLLRIARRDNGIRIYEAARKHTERLSQTERAKLLIFQLIKIFGPLPQKSLQEIAGKLKSAAPALSNVRAVLSDMVRSGEVDSREVDGATYVGKFDDTSIIEVPRSVRFLAPFDPLVWDRRRFEHLFGWAYRFEAYTPVAKRVRGYYALPLLWCDKIIGWANASIVSGELDVELGFVGRKPRDTLFRSELEVEIQKFSEFLKLE